MHLFFIFSCPVSLTFLSTVPCFLFWAFVLFRYNEFVIKPSKSFFGLSFPERWLVCLSTRRIFSRTKNSLWISKLVISFNFLWSLYLPNASSKSNLLIQISSSFASTVFPENTDDNSSLCSICAFPCIGIQSVCLMSRATLLDLSIITVITIGLKRTSFGHSFYRHFKGFFIIEGV